MKYGCAPSRISSRSKSSKSNLHGRLASLYRRSLAHFGPLHWWPGDTAFEVCVGAILTQNTAWTNVKLAIDNLKQNQLLDLDEMERAAPVRLAELIRPSGYFNQKAKKLKHFCCHVVADYDSDLNAMWEQPLPALREELLALHGIGPETADSIILYAAHKPIFVVDAYTRRILSRMGLIKENISYQELQDLFHRHVPPDVEHYGEFHAQLVYLGKGFCRKSKPRCTECPIRLK